MLATLAADLQARPHAWRYDLTADTGGLMQNHAPTIYAYGSLDALLEGESAGGAKSALPGAAGANGKAVTERP